METRELVELIKLGSHALAARVEELEVFVERVRLKAAEWGEVVDGRPSRWMALAMECQELLEKEQKV